MKDSALIPSHNASKRSAPPEVRTLARTLSNWFDPILCCQRRVAYRWCGSHRISYHVYHIHADISEQMNGDCFASARRGTSPSVADRLSNSLTPRAPCRWRAVVGGVDQRSTAGTSPNHRRLPFAFGHLPSLSAVVHTYPHTRPIGGMRNDFDRANSSQLCSLEVASRRTRCTATKQERWLEWFIRWMKGARERTQLRNHIGGVIDPRSIQCDQRANGD
jgi:hypothetical protein